jgi:hypothetical protein
MTVRINLTTVRMDIIKSTNNNECCKDVDRKHLYTVGGNVKQYNQYGK